ncbi:MAG: hypothetical protein RSB67_01550 [Clostridia bacterium]
MNEFNILLNISETICTKNCKENFERSVSVTSTSQKVILQDGYILNIIAIGDDYFTVLIQNGVETIIRNVYTSFPLQMCLPNKCAKHLLTLSGKIINT